MAKQLGGAVRHRASESVSVSVAVLAAFAALVSGPVARAADPLSLYVGAFAGRSSLQFNQIDLASNTSWSPHADGWKALVGWHPLPLLSAEAQYVDFGKSNQSLYTSSGSSGSAGTTTSAHSTAVTVDALVYYPIPLPFLDLYGKFGVARVANKATSQAFCTSTSTQCAANTLTLLQNTHNSATYGIGAGVHFENVGARLEYERFSQSSGDAQLYSIGVTLRF